MGNNSRIIAPYKIALSKEETIVIWIRTILHIISEIHTGLLHSAYCTSNVFLPTLMKADMSHGWLLKSQEKEAKGMPEDAKLLSKKIELYLQSKIKDFIVEIMKWFDTK